MSIRYELDSRITCPYCGYILYRGLSEDVFDPVDKIVCTCKKCKNRLTLKMVTEYYISATYEQAEGFYIDVGVNNE